MSRRKKIDRFKSSFNFDVTDTHIYSREDGIKDLETRTNIGGVYFDVKKETEDGNYTITTRVRDLRCGLMDYNHIKHSIERNYGPIREETFWGKYYLQRKEMWEAFRIEGDKIIPINEWSRFDEMNIKELL